MYRCITGEYARPYSEFQNIVVDFQILVQAATNQLRPTIPKDCPPEVEEILKSCWNPDEEKRPFAEDLLKQLAFVKSAANISNWKCAPKKQTKEKKILFFKKSSAV